MISTRDKRAAGIENATAEALLAIAGYTIQLEDEVKELECRADTASEVIAARDKSITVLKEDIEKKKKALAGCADQIEELLNKTRTHPSELIELQSKYESIEKAFRVKAESMRQVDEERGKAIIEARTLEVSLQQMTKQRDDAMELIHDLENENEAMEKELKKTQRQLKQVQRNFEAYRTLMAKKLTKKRHAKRIH